MLKPRRLGDDFVAMAVEHAGDRYEGRTYFQLHRQHFAGDSESRFTGHHYVQEANIWLVALYYLHDQLSVGACVNDVPFAAQDLCQRHDGVHIVVGNEDAQAGWRLLFLVVMGLHRNSLPRAGYAQCHWLYYGLVDRSLH